ncbi:YfgM family protein [Alysiella crassa]|uniref:Ancillary SecYEG translocon subunit n=1 Tax=Alysiella crassa TaxID=153491 RepID=A0A376BVS3_9NEIS|nr:tetratricopeptide repeat protein [Alysiella crassa]UOP05987.1 tetratricopeptide repeat protein [Alysiella crassa]SSY80434.1 tetratricopeptide repeat protein [Alysiella crassa]
MSAHHDEQQELENAKHLWQTGGKWVFAALVAAALGYLGNVIYKGQVNSQNQEAATLAAQVKGDTAKLSALQQSHGKSAAAAQASLETAKTLFDNGKLDEAAAAYRWVLDNQKAPLFQAAAAQSLANVLLQQKKFDEALSVLNTPVDDSFAPLMNETKGDVLAAQGKNKEAAEAYQLALDKLPENSASRELVQLKLGQL